MPDPSDRDDRVVPIRPGVSGRNNRWARDQSPDEAPNDLKKFERVDERDDYRERMITNAIAAGFLIFLIVAGVWIANTMAAMRKNQDCVLSGRRGCTPVDAPPSARW